MEKPTCSEKTALLQAKFTTQDYLNNAIEMLDGKFGGGYAAGHSELIGQLVIAQAMDFNNTSITSAIHTLAEHIVNELYRNLEGVLQEGVDHLGIITEEIEKRNI